MGDWSTLPIDLLQEVVMRFETIEDLVYFSVVCRLWNHAATMVKHKFNVKALPWLLLAENTEDNNPEGLRKVFNPYNNRYYQLKLPETFGCRCWGSAHGWLVTYNPYFDLHMFNPFTKARLSLPSITSLPYQWGCYFPHPYNGALKKMRSRFIYKAIVIKASEDDFIVFVIYFLSRKFLAFARPGDQSWTSIDQPGSSGEFSDMTRCVNDVAHCGTRILILNDDDSVGFLSISDLSDPQKLVQKDYLPRRPIYLSDQRNLGVQVGDYLPCPWIEEVFDLNVYGTYMVYSSGDIFMVLRDRYKVKDDAMVYKTCLFVVFQLDFDSQKWSRVHHLRDAAVFVGNCSSMSVPTSSADKFKSNCIYYNDDYNEGWHQPKTLGGEDMGVFNLQDNELDYIHKGCYTYSKRQTPLWFIPQF